MPIKSFKDRVTIDFNMLSALIKNKIDNNMTSTSVVSMERGKNKLRKIEFSQ